LWEKKASSFYALPPRPSDPNLIALQTEATQQNAALARFQRCIYIVERYQITTRRNKKKYLLSVAEVFPICNRIISTINAATQKKMHNRTQ
jgi:hypothetical protein